MDNKTGPVAKKEQLKKPFRISVSKSDVHVHYPVKYLFVSFVMIIIFLSYIYTFNQSVNNKPFEKSYSVRNIILGINKCRRRNCRHLKVRHLYSKLGLLIIILISGLLLQFFKERETIKNMGI